MPLLESVPPVSFADGPCPGISPEPRSATARRGFQGPGEVKELGRGRLGGEPAFDEATDEFRVRLSERGSQFMQGAALTGIKPDG